MFFHPLIYTRFALIARIITAVILSIAKHVLSLSKGISPPMNPEIPFDYALRSIPCGQDGVQNDTFGIWLQPEAALWIRCRRTV